MEQRVTVSSELIAMVIESILYGDDTGFEQVLEEGFSEIELFAEAMRKSEKTFIMTTITPQEIEGRKN